MARAAEEQDVFRHLFILKTPNHDPENLNKCCALRLATTLRHRIEPFPNAPHGYYIVEDDRNKGEQEIFAFFQGNDILRALQDIRRSRQSAPRSDPIEHSSQKLPATTAPSPLPAGHSQRGRALMRGFHNHGSTSHAHISSSTLPNLPSSLANSTPHAESSTSAPTLPFSSAITHTDRNSLIPLKRIADQPGDLSDHLYSMRIEIEPSQMDIGVTGQEYVLPIDTASSSIWFFQAGFMRLVEGTDSQGHTQLAIQHWDPPELVSGKRTVPRHLAENTICAEMCYVDSGKALVERYPKGHEISALVPSWDWNRGQEVQTQLPIPRVLAYAANEFLTTQYLDGNLGLAVPGWTFPFDHAHPSTFFDAIARDLQDSPGKHVDRPTRMTLRLLHPSVVAADCPDNVQSYLYYGIYWPCAIDDGTSAEQKRVPSFTPKIWVLPTRYIYLPGPGDRKDREYERWTIRVASVALLVPKVPRANKQAPVPCRDNEDDWTAKVIEIYDYLYTASESIVDEDITKIIGLPVTLDTCSTESVLPDTLCEAIATKWLGLDVTKHQLRANPEQLYCPDELDLDDCDILFTFLGEANSRVKFQCPASRFLKTVWREPLDRGHYVPIRARASTARSASWIFGQNFFWSAFVRLDCSLRGDRATVGNGTKVNVRLAPQRAKDAEGKYWMDERSIRFHELPGRLEAERLGQAGLKYDLD